MSVEKRLDKLEQAIGTTTDEEAPPLVVVWPEDETPEQRAAYRKAADWYKRHGGLPSEVRVDWSADEVPE